MSISYSTCLLIELNIRHKFHDHTFSNVRDLRGWYAIKLEQGIQAHLLYDTQVIGTMNVIHMLSTIANGEQKRFSKSMLVLDRTYSVPYRLDPPLKFTQFGYNDISSTDQKT